MLEVCQAVPHVCHEGLQNRGGCHVPLTAHLPAATGNSSAVQHSSTHAKAAADASHLDLVTCSEPIFPAELRSHQPKELCLPGPTCTWLRCALPLPTNAVKVIFCMTCLSGHPGSDACSTLKH